MRIKLHESESAEAANKVAKEKYEAGDFNFTIVAKEVDSNGKLFHVVYGDWNPYAWHKGKYNDSPRWRVKAGMHEERLRRIDALTEYGDRELKTYGDRQLKTFEAVDTWHKMKQAVLDCEETEEIELVQVGPSAFLNVFKAKSR